MCVCVFVCGRVRVRGCVSARARVVERAFVSAREGPLSGLGGGGAQRLLAAAGLVEAAATVSGEHGSSVLGPRSHTCPPPPSR